MSKVIRAQNSEGKAKKGRPKITWENFELAKIRKECSPIIFNQNLFFSHA